MCVPNVDGLRKRILEEDHGSFYSIHPGLTKIYHDLKEVFLQKVLNKDTEEFVSKYQNFKQVKAEQQKLGDLLQKVKVPTCKLEDTNMDFVVGFPLTQKQYDSLWVAVDKFTKSAHFITSKSTYLWRIMQGSS